jgi:hypothetical protein
MSSLLGLDIDLLMRPSRHCVVPRSRAEAWFSGTAGSSSGSVESSSSCSEREWDARMPERVLV